MAQPINPEDKVGRIRKSSITLVIAAVVILVLFVVVYAYNQSKKQPDQTQQQQQDQTETKTRTTLEGGWGGSYISEPDGTDNCPVSGPVSFMVRPNKDLGGYMMVGADVLSASGKVDDTGKISGSWKLGKTEFRFTGNLDISSSTGQGTYQNGECSGKFQVKGQ